MRLSSHVVGVAVLAFALATPSAAAADVQVQAGRSYMDSYPANALFIEGVFDARQFGGTAWRWSPDVSVGWIDGRAVARYRDSRYSTRDEVWLLAAGVRVQHGAVADGNHGWFVSFQPAVTRGRTQALSSAYEFVSSVGWQGRRFSVQLRHISNASLHQPNRGETMALVGIGFEL